MDRWTDRQVDRGIDRWMDRWTDTWWYKLDDIVQWTERQAEWETDGSSNRSFIDILSNVKINWRNGQRTKKIRHEFVWI